MRSPCGRTRRLGWSCFPIPRRRCHLPDLARRGFGEICLGALPVQHDSHPRGGGGSMSSASLPHAKPGLFHGNFLSGDGAEPVRAKPLLQQTAQGAHAILYVRLGPQAQHEVGGHGLPGSGISTALESPPRRSRGASLPTRSPCISRRSRGQLRLNSSMAEPLARGEPSSASQHASVLSRR